MKENKTQQIKNLLAEGVSVKDIAAKVNCTTGYVYIVKGKSNTTTTTKATKTAKKVKTPSIVTDIDTLETLNLAFGVLINDKISDLKKLNILTTIFN